MKFVTAVTLTLSLALSSARSNAQTAADEATRSELVREADDAAHANDHARALDLATRAGVIRMTPSLQLLIAQEQRALHRDLDAYANALACERAAQADASLRNREDILGTCGALARALQGTIGRVRIQLTGPASGVVLRVNGEEVPVSAGGMARPVGAGSVTVEARAEGYAPWSQAFTVNAGQLVDANVTLVRLASVVRAPVAPVAPARSPGPGPWIVAGAGVLSFVAAGVFYGLAMGAQSDRDTLCPAGRSACDRRAEELDATYARNLTITNVTLIAGTALVAGGAVWYILARNRAPSRATLTVAPAWAAGGAAMVISGSF